MLVQVNGKPREIAPGTCVASLLQQLELKVHHVVVERNGTIVANESFKDTTLTEGDALEIVQFVGGG